MYPSLSCISHNPAVHQLGNSNQPVNNGLKQFLLSRRQGVGLEAVVAQSSPADLAENRAGSSADSTHLLAVQRRQLRDSSPRLPGVTNLAGRRGNELQTEE
ncbi:hypothetical protein KOW79_007937 [Hemibagrus wyckioides]|uniref:Uncharacterized protein n=1 Tax=Hemibagrus wyckioides TaxID=337641 RepID=A0A9D3SQN6_9TELE|nr:hypothetical protein KOW79_007937 [Hemibagrus wyckioides]